MTWSAVALERIDSAGELEIAVKRPDGGLRRPLPIWVVRVADQVFVRTWHRRDTGWFGRAVAEGLARIRVPGVEADVTVQDIGVGTAQLRADIDAAYRTKYGNAGAASMVTAAAAASTLRLDPAEGGSTDSRTSGPTLPDPHWPLPPGGLTGGRASGALTKRTPGGQQPC